MLPPKPEGGIMVFGRIGTGFSGWSKAKTELDDAISAARRKRHITEAIPPWRVHDLRRTFVTLVSEKGFAPPHIVEVIVNHVSGTKGGVAGVYNKALYVEERTQALAAWGRYVAGLVGESRGGSDATKG
jgi:integrase